MRTAVYVRVSTEEQKTASQERDLRRWLTGNGIGDPEWYIDHGYTRDNFDRPEFTRMQEDIFNGEIGTIVVWKLDRLSGTLLGGLTVLCDWLQRGLRVVSVTQQIDFSGATGKLMAAVLLGLSEIEQSTRRERQRAGIEAAKENGVYRGRKPGTTKATPARAAELRARGLTDSEIGRALGVSRATVQRYLKAASSNGRSN